MRYLKSIFFQLALVLIFSGFNIHPYAQQTDSTEFAFLPALAYNSDFGLIAGGVTNWYNFKDNTKPFYSYLSLSAIISTKGLASFDLVLDKPFLFGKNIRQMTQVYGSRFFNDLYFGIANRSKINGAPQDLPDYFTFQSFTLGFLTNSRFPVFRFNENKQIDARIGINFRYETPWENGIDRLIMVEKPLGYNGARVAMVSAGLVWEGRDHEFNPTRGNYAEAGFAIGSSILGSNYSLITAEYDFRQYYSFYLIRDITFAVRFSGKNTSGEVPYWELAYAGDEETLRGYYARRFLDDNVAILNTELRTWLFQIPSSDIKIGGTLFIDTASTYSNGTAINTAILNRKQTLGFGGLMTLFTPDFIIRGDIGFSDEGYGIYFSLGYMF